MNTVFTQSGFVSRYWHLSHSCWHCFGHPMYTTFLPDRAEMCRMWLSTVGELVPFNPLLQEHQITLQGSLPVFPSALLPEVIGPGISTTTFLLSSTCNSKLPPLYFCITSISTSFNHYYYFLFFYFLLLFMKMFWSFTWKNVNDVHVKQLVRGRLWTISQLYPLHLWLQFQLNQVAACIVNGDMKPRTKLLHIQVVGRPNPVRVTKVTDLIMQCSTELC